VVVKHAGETALTRVINMFNALPLIRDRLAEF
jgi:hypothetical protein